ncbi:MAG: hypothetical protein WCS85_00285 [Candidatus Peribacteraceae bacterium]|jgi:hypothetical protein
MSRFLFIQTAFAQIIPASGKIGDSCNFATGDLHFSCVPLFIANLVLFLFGGLGTFAIIQIILAGYEIATGAVFGGSTDQGKKRLKNSLIGLAFSVLCFAIVNFVVNTLTS